MCYSYMGVVSSFDTPVSMGACLSTSKGLISPTTKGQNDTKIGVFAFNDMQ